MLFVWKYDRFLFAPGAFHVFQVFILVVKMMPEHLQNGFLI